MRKVTKKIIELEEKIKLLKDGMKLEKALSKYSVFKKRGWNPIDILANEVYLNTIYIRKMKKI